MKRNFINDILRDTDSRKFSATKFAAIITLFLLTIAVGSSIWIMIENKEIDHIVIGELIALLLTLLGFKNSKDKKKIEAENGILKKKKKEKAPENLKDTLINDMKDELG